MVENDKTCGCTDENCEGEDVMTTEELAEHADDKVDALIKLLLKKGIISDKEFEEEYESLFEKDSEEKPKTTE